MEKTVKKNEKQSMKVMKAQKSKKEGKMIAFVEKKRMEDTSIAEFGNGINPFMVTARKAKKHLPSECDCAIKQVVIAIKMIAKDKEIQDALNEYLSLKEKHDELIEKSKNASTLNEKGDFRMQAKLIACKRNEAHQKYNEMKKNAIQKYAGSAINLLLENYYEYATSVALHFFYMYGSNATDAMQIASTDRVVYAIIAYARKCIANANFAKTVPLNTVIYDSIKWFSKRFWRYLYVVKPSMGDSALNSKNEDLRERNRQSFLSMQHSTTDSEGNSVEFQDAFSDEEHLNALQMFEEDEMNAIRERIKEKVLSELTPLNRAMFEGIYLHGKQYRELHKELQAQFPEYDYSDYNGLYARVQTLLAHIRQKVRDAMKEN